MPILGATVALLAGSWLGVGPAMLVGLSGGLVRAFWLSGNSLCALQMAIVASFAAWCVQQKYQGRWHKRLRQPVVAGALSGFVSVLLTMVTRVAAAPRGPWAVPGLADALQVGWANLGPTLAEWALAGLLVGWIVSRSPAPAEESEPKVVPPWNRSLTARLISRFVPLFVAVLLLATGGLILIEVRAITSNVLAQSALTAEVISTALTDWDAENRSLLTALASEEILKTALARGQSQEATAFIGSRADYLAESTVREIVLLRPDGTTMGVYPPTETSTTLQPSESQAFQTMLASGRQQVALDLTDAGRPVVSYLVPVGAAGGGTLGVLAGRSDVTAALEPLLQVVAGSRWSGQSLITDQDGYVLASYPDQEWKPSWSPDQYRDVQELTAEAAESIRGRAFLGTDAAGTRHMVYQQATVEHPWQVVIQAPYDAVLRHASDHAARLALGLAAAGTIAIASLVVLANRTHRPLADLARDTACSAATQASPSVHLHSPDEIGRLATAIDAMRLALQTRASELQLLLDVSQNATPGLALGRGLNAILDGALQATGADGARVLTLTIKEQGAITQGKGRLARTMSRLDLTIVRWLRQESILRAEDSGQVSALFKTSELGEPVGAVLALPLRSEQRYHGVLWVAFQEPHPWSRNQVNLMTALAGQALTLVENVQLFEAAEGGRRRLAAILASTGDVVLVTDAQNRILLANPAAEAVLVIPFDKAPGQPAVNVVEHPALLAMLTLPDAPTHNEIELTNGRVLDATASAVTSEENLALGRVVILRDVTRIKERDELKAEYVYTVSHDLRTPLTYMRGYVTMLPIVGELAPKQTEYVTKILTGIDQMTKLVESVLDLAHLEADAQHILRPTDISPVLLATAENHRHRAVAKGLTLEVTVDQPLPPVQAEPVLLAQALANLLENAIAFTASGCVTLRAYVRGEEVLIQVQDTGPGIAPPDQVRLFEKFYRVKRADTTESKGSGLGLAIVKSIVEHRHHGRVWLESQLGVGSSFYLALPIVDRKAA